jgi:hypothetical protein
VDGVPSALIQASFVSVVLTIGSVAILGIGGVLGARRLLARTRLGSMSKGAAAVRLAVFVACALVACWTATFAAYLHYDEIISDEALHSFVALQSVELILAAVVATAGVAWICMD